MSMNFVTFNQDYSYLAVATSKGFRIFTTDPFAKSYETKEGNIAIIEMLFSTSLVALILSPRRLQITNTKRQSTICELTFPTTVLAVKLNRKRLVIVLEDQIYLYDIQTMKLLYTIETSPNPNALCALSPSSDNCYLAYPLPQKAPPSTFQPPAHAPPGTTHVTPTSGEVLIFDTLKLEAINVIEAHRSPLACITLNSDGTLIATASDKGTIIRVFSVPDGRKLYQFRRGSIPSRIYSMSFNTTSTLLCVSSSTETIHLFKLSLQSQSPDATPSSSLTAADRRSSQSSLGQLSDADDRGGDMAASELASRKHNGTLMGMIRRTSQNVGSTFAAKVGGYLPKGVSEMWEPARDFAWIKLPKSNQGPGANGNNGPLRSVVAMSANTPQVMVVTSDGNFYVFNIDLSKGGEGTLTKQYSVLDTNDRLGYSVMDY
ncbi:autophagy protein [Aspergillus tubingensis]|uniref:Autophagy-related protein 18 n=5 Tax=Aspergillus subgen. Circumdati TaxID=2720871 RepID=A0A124BY29_ASPNG|nr:autophagy-related protein 18 [Aspergillus neoniger CBS 115656]XP_025536937.1 autophagy-related protein 18 [Aspergillus costaricaensis CBS 115574]XP_025565465.1 autophagy-related protein 18 [Aspergillus vadensis CBS 113365]XP_035351320.1 autophagy-related protein 18 [Aspergillus tubingensis]GAQ44258.1 autophagy-related protein 18 [Aspergillus niger]PYH37854.1 autophagy-related protein 18 [Aspergillus neoniger CBS 115656]PYH71671.1 autophagy-related protein 18 [Aspergillus vadensis CBS 11336